MSEMNEGIRILIDRMKTHPDDFSPYGVSSYDWRGLAQHVIESAETFTDEERQAVTTALQGVTRKTFTAHVLSMLAGPPPKTYYEEKYSQEYDVKRYAQNMMAQGSITSPLHNKIRLQSSDE
jgi:hypothetical protein